MNDLLLSCVARIRKMLIWIINAPKVRAGMGFVQSDFLLIKHTLHMQISKPVCKHYYLPLHS